MRLRGIQDQASARALVVQARERAQLDADEAMALAVDFDKAGWREDSGAFLETKCPIGRRVGLVRGVTPQFALTVEAIKCRLMQ